MLWCSAFTAFSSSWLILRTCKWRGKFVVLANCPVLFPRTWRSSRCDWLEQVQSYGTRRNCRRKAHVPEWTRSRRSQSSLATCHPGDSPDCSVSLTRSLRVIIQDNTAAGRRAAGSGRTGRVELGSATGICLSCYYSATLYMCVKRVAYSHIPWITRFQMSATCSETSYPFLCFAFFITLCPSSFLVFLLIITSVW
jgi:hypothetical protein